MILAEVHITRREFSKGEEALEQSLIMKDDVGVRQALAWVYWVSGDVDRAIVEQTRVLEKLEADGFPGSAARAHNSLGSIYYFRGSYDACVTQQRMGLAEVRKWPEPNNPHLIRILSNLSECLLELGRYDEAEPLLEEALSILENPGRQIDPGEAEFEVHATLALLRTGQGRVEEARKALEEAQTARERLLATEPSARTFAMEFWREDTAAQLARVEAKLAAAEGRRSDAIALFETSLQLYEGLAGPSSPILRVILEDYLGALHAAGEDQRAADVERRLAAISARPEGGAAP